MDLEGQLSNPDKPLKTLVPQGFQARRGSRESRPTRQRRGRTRREPRSSDELGHYSNPSLESNSEDPFGDGCDASPPAARHRVQRRLRATAVDALVDFYGAGDTIMQLADRFGISRSTVMAHLDRRDVQRRATAKHWDYDALAAAARSYAGGDSLARIADQYGLDPQTVANRLRKAGVAIRPRRGTR